MSVDGVYTSEYLVGFETELLAHAHSIDASPLPPSYPSGGPGITNKGLETIWSINTDDEDEEDDENDEDDEDDNDDADMYLCFGVVFAELW